MMINLYKYLLIDETGGIKILTLSYSPHLKSFALEKSSFTTYVTGEARFPLQV